VESFHYDQIRKYYEKTPYHRQEKSDGRNYALLVFMIDRGKQHLGRADYFDIIDQY